MTVTRAVDHGAIPVLRAPDAQVRFNRFLTFISAIAIGIGLAVLWNHRVSDPIAMAIQQGVVGTTTPVEVLGAAALAFVAGASMIVTA
ncbi:MAG: hypothetical protein HYY02_09865 [Chloroflexi bacterium]|nr:hypothetical protein [Chloroflexota bacterium]